MPSAKRVLSCGMNAHARCVHEPLLSVPAQVAWRIRLACSQIEAWGAWQRSRFAQRDAEIFECWSSGRDSKSRDTKACFVW